MKITRPWLYTLLALPLLVYFYFESQRENDFHIFYTAAQDYAAGKNMYEIRYQIWNHFLYSPFFALLMQPLTWLPVQVAQFIWLTGGLLMLIFIIKRVHYFMFGEHGYTRTDWIILLLTLLAGSRFLRDNFHFGQSTILILFTCTEGVFQCLKGRYWLAGLLFALGINIKLMPLVFVPWMLVRGYYKALIFTFCFLGLYYLTPVLYTGWEHNKMLLGSWWALLNPARPIHLLDIDENSYHSISSLMPALFTDLKNLDSPDIRRHIVLLDHKTVVLISNLLRATVILLTLFALVKKWFKPVAPSPGLLREISYILLATPLVFPHQQVYAFLFSLPAVIYLLHQLWKMDKGLQRTTLITVLVLFTLCENLGLWLGEFKPYFEHYKIVTYGAITLLISVIIVKPKKTIER